MKKILHNAGNASLVEEDQGYDEDDYLDGCIENDKSNVLIYIYFCNIFNCSNF